jgi:uncharacterized protein YbjT (DUF2867 family)
MTVKNKRAGTSMALRNKIITVVGGSGFLGRYVVKLLAEKGYIVRVLVRDVEAASFLKTSGDVGQVALISADITQEESLKGKLDGSFAVINLVGILFESRSQSFAAVHAQGAERLAKLASSVGAARFIQVSSLGVDLSVSSTYARTKEAGEKAVKAAFPDATILRPSVMFGAEDGLFNKFAQMAMLSPVLPLIGGGKTRFQPVYVMDVAHAIISALENPETKGQTYELGGPKIYSFKELLEFLLITIHRKRCLLNIPAGIASVMGIFAGMLPTPPITRDQVKLLGYDNVVGANVKTFNNLGIKPTALELIAPTYLERFKKRNTA